MLEETLQTSQIPANQVQQKLDTRERPFCAHQHEVKAILEEKQTQFRRAVRLPKYHNHDDIDTASWFWNCYQSIDGGRTNDFKHWQCGDFWCYPNYQIGDMLWVKETFCTVDDTQYGGEKWIDYRATPKYESSHPAGWENAPRDAEALKWKPSIHMPRGFSRITLQILDVRIERLCDISDSEAIANGIRRNGERAYFAPGDLSVKMDYPFYPTPHEAFIAMWKYLYKRSPQNPWVWVVTFKRV